MASTDLRARLALDRYLMGVWTERDLVAAHARAPLPPAVMAIVERPALDRPRAAEQCRAQLFGAERPSEVEQLEALLREGVERAESGASILKELQVDLQVRARAVPRDDARALAVKSLGALAGAAAVNLAVQAHGPLAEATVDRMALAREKALEELRQHLRDFPHLAPT